VTFASLISAWTPGNIGTARRARSIRDRNCSIRHRRRAPAGRQPVFPRRLG